MAAQWMEQALTEAGFEICAQVLPGYDYRLILWRKNQRCLDIVRASYRAALRAAYFTVIQPEEDMLDKLTLAERTEVLRVRAEIQQAAS